MHSKVTAFYKAQGLKLDLFVDTAMQIETAKGSVVLKDMEDLLYNNLKDEDDDVLNFYFSKFVANGHVNTQAWADINRQLGQYM